MYKSRIKAWRLDKKNKAHEVAEILRQQAARRALGKKSSFVIRGRMVDIADVERYATRKGLALDFEPASTAPITVPDLMCFTPPPTPVPVDAPTSMRNVEHFIYSFDAFVRESLQLGLWELGRDVRGFACVLGSEYPTTARDGFFLAIERGVKRYQLGDITQAYRQWRTAFDGLRTLVSARRPSQLLCLIDLFARLAECQAQVAGLLLRYLGDLTSDFERTDPCTSMLQSLSRLQSEDLLDLTSISHDCSRSAFSGYFQRDAFFLLDSETILTPSPSEHPSPVSTHCQPPSQLIELALSWEPSDISALRVARSVLELLNVPHRHDEAEQIAKLYIQRMHEMPYNGVVGGAFSHAYSYLAHIHLQAQNHEQAYHYTKLKVENYFRMLEYRTDLPEDFILSSFELLASLAQELERNEEAEQWWREHEILKRRTDALAESELAALKGQREELPVSLGRQRNVPPEEGEMGQQQNISTSSSSSGHSAWSRMEEVAELNCCRSVRE
jgi:hypothetical protein